MIFFRLTVHNRSKEGVFLNGDVKPEANILYESSEKLLLFFYKLQIQFHAFFSFVKEVHSLKTFFYILYL
jgi:hypothetical protein